MSDEVLLNGSSCPEALTNGANGYYLGMSGGKPTWLPFSTITSRTLTVTNGTNVEMGSIDDLTDVDTSTVAPVNGQILTYNSTTGQWEPKTAGGHPLAQISQTNAPFSANTATQVFNIPAVPVLTPNNTTGILTFQPGDGTTVTIDICTLVAACNLDARVTSGNGAPAATAGDPIVYTDLLTKNVYYRDVAGNVAVIDLPMPDITSGNGTPPVALNQPTFWTDLLTGNTYYRAPDGSTVLLSQNYAIPITSGVGVPAATVNSATIYTDTATGDIYYRDLTGALVKIFSRSLPIAAYEETDVTGLVYTYDASSSGSTQNDVTLSTYAWTISAVGTSGVATLGTPSASTTTVTYPGVGSWLLTLTVTDSNGNTKSVTKLVTIDQPLPVAAYEITSKDSTNRIWTFDAASSTSTGDGSTLSTYAWTIAAVGTSGVATLATPAASSTTITFPGVGSWLVTLTITDSNGNTETVTKLIEVTDSPLVAAYETTSKIALQAAFDASSSVGAVTYAWTAVAINGTTATATFGTPAAVATTVTFSDEGEWQITLTITDAAGNTKSVTKDIAAARILHVNGASVDVNGQHFLSLQTAFNWINTNDAANDDKYTIFIYGTTTDAARIVPNNAQVHFEPTGRINVGVDFPAGTFKWSGELIRNNLSNGIQNAAGDTITCVAGTVLTFEGVNINATDAAAYAITGTSWIGVFNNCQMFSLGGGIQSFTSGTFNFIHCSFDVRGATLNCLNLQGCIVIAEHSRFSHSQGITMLLTATSGRIFNCDIACNRAVVAGQIAACIDVDANGLASTLNIANCVLTANNASIAPGFTCGLRIQGSSAFIYVSNNSIIANTYGIVLHTSVLNNTPRLIMNGCMVYGTTNPIIGTSSLATVVAAAITGLRIYNMTFQGAPQALLTFAAGTAFGANIGNA